MTDDLQVWVSPGVVPVVHLVGRILLSEASTLQSLLSDLLAGNPDGVVCDVGRLQVPISESWLAVFPAALRRSGGWPRSQLRLAAADSRLARALDRVGMRRYVPLDSTVSGAVHELRTHRPIAYREATLPAEPLSVRAARDLVRSAHSGSGRPVRSETLLVVDELAANAVRHVRADFTLSVRVQPEEVLLAITDPSRAEPLLRPPSMTAHDGRGLQLVDALSRAWGVRFVHPDGKSVWAVLDERPEAS